MQTLGTRARVAVVSSMVVAWAFLAYACSPTDENPGATRVFADSGEGGTVDPKNDPDAQLGAPICGKYGDYANVKVIAAALTARASADCRIGTPLSNLDAPSKQHLAECFEIQLGGAFQCPGISYISGTTKDSKGNQCRSMTDAHKGLNLRKADFDAFVEDVAAELAAKGLSTADIRALAPVFEGTRTGITQANTQPDKNTFCACPNGEYMGKSCVVEAGIIDAGPDVSDTGVKDSGDSG